MVFSRVTSASCATTTGAAAALSPAVGVVGAVKKKSVLTAVVYSGLYLPPVSLSTSLPTCFRMSSIFNGSRIHLARLRA